MGIRTIADGRALSQNHPMASINRAGDLRGHEVDRGPQRQLPKLAVSTAENDACTQPSEHSRGGRHGSGVERNARNEFGS